MKEKVQDVQYRFAPSDCRHLEQQQEKFYVFKNRIDRQQVVGLKNKSEILVVQSNRLPVIQFSDRLP